MCGLRENLPRAGRRLVYMPGMLGAVPQTDTRATAPGADHQDGRDKCRDISA